ncbi:MAG TPA: dihydroorotate dehydrogenase [Dehalococcoidia bacterium]|nr:dihydroorotate dehydrogenase [Dehalococcoidia bacterium]
MIDLQVNLAPLNSRGLFLSNPVMTASGAFGYGTEIEGFEIEKVGALVCKGTTLLPREGNPQPRIVECDGGILNSVGLQNIGLDDLIKLKAPVWARWKIPVVVNIAGATIEEYANIASRLEGVKGVSGIEVNISCPNVKEGGIEFGSNAELAAAVTHGVKQATGLPVIVKLSPNVTDIAQIALAVCHAGADALTLSNTWRGMAIDINTGKAVLGNVYGGFSGPAIKPLALYLVYRVSQVVNVPIIGCGGICSAEDAVEFFMAGASAVQVGTAALNSPEVFSRVISGLQKYLEDRGCSSIRDIIGLAHSRKS